MATSCIEVNLYVLMTVITITWAHTVMSDVEGLEGGAVTIPCTLIHQGTLRWRIGDGQNIIATKSLAGQVIIQHNGPYTGEVSITGEFNLRISALDADRDNNRQFTCEDPVGGGSQVKTVIVLGPQPFAVERYRGDSAETTTTTDSRTVTNLDNVTGGEMSRTNYETLHVPDVSEVQTRRDNYDQVQVPQRVPRRLNAQYENTVVQAENRPELLSNSSHNAEIQHEC